MEAQTTHSTSIWRSMGTVGQKLHEKQCKQCWGTDQSRRTFFFNINVYYRGDIKLSTVESSQFGR